MIFRYNTNKKTCVILYPKKDLVKKIFSINKNFKKNEINGNLWYLKSLRSKQVKLKIASFKKNLLIVNLPLFKGKQINFWENISFNQKYIKRVMDHYLQIWPKRKYVPFHGDLTFSNLIFGQNFKDVRIIDWENFKSKNYEWGLDICYFLISAISLPALSRKNCQIFENEKQVFKNLWQSFFLEKKFNYIDNPFKYFEKKKLMKSDNFIFKIPKNMRKEIFQVIKS